MYPGNHTESEILSVPRNLKTRPGAPETHLAYITHDEGELLKKHKPGTPHKGPHDIPNYDSWDWMASDSSSSGSPHGGDGGDGNYFDPWVDDYRTPTADNRPLPIDVPSQAESDWAGEFADVPSNIDAWPTPADPYNWTTSDYGGVDPTYQAYLDNLERHTNEQGFSYYMTPGQSWFDRRDEQLISAFGGLTGEWDALAGLSEDDKNRMWRLGEFEWPLGGSGTRGGRGPGPGSGGYYSGRGGYGGGGGGGGGSRMQVAGSGGDAYMRPRWGQSEIQRRYIDRMRRANRGGIVSLC